MAYAVYTYFRRLRYVYSGWHIIWICLISVIGFMLIHSGHYPLSRIRYNYNHIHFPEEPSNTSKKMEITTDEIKNKTISRREDFTNQDHKDIVTPVLIDEITIVTGYWNIGSFQKGRSKSMQFGPGLYERWMQRFRYIFNPVIFYTDSEKFAGIMRTIRKCSYHRTQIKIIQRNSSWAFKNVDKIKVIYSNPKYPKHHPNTVIPEYACAQHAKYDVIARAAKDNLYRTKYFAWLDIGYFRERKSNVNFRLNVPGNFNKSMIAMNQVGEKKRNVIYKEIFHNLNAWVGGGLFLGRHDVIINHAHEFKRAVDFFIETQLINTDQHVLYAMYSEKGLKEFKPRTQIQTYTSIKRGRPNWFYLGTHMIRELNGVDSTCG